ncbi:MAG: hypothetical protein HYZ51_00465 [Candidatus Doudnabacteria bacterium]|nr:hypothetical protein [Candidatus Doudnabacteria bacterium]
MNWILNFLKRRGLWSRGVTNRQLMFIFVFLITSLFLFVDQNMILAVGSGGGGSGGGAVCSQDTWVCIDWGTCGADGKQIRTCQLQNDCAYVANVTPVLERACTPSCAQDTWTCTNWGACLTSGSQNRTCTRTFDCALVETPKPPERQSCTSACTEDIWECTAFSACSKKGSQTRSCKKTFDCSSVDTPKPSETASCQTACRQDEFSCGQWSSCDKNGTQSRSCELIKDCFGVNTPKPSLTQACTGLRCGQLLELKDRIVCRLGLTEEQYKQEVQIQYFPEYCKTEDTETGQQVCIQLYRDFSTCWAMPFGDKRMACGKKIIGFEDVNKQVAVCLATTGQSRTTCALELKEKVEKFIIFELYEMEARAEDLLRMGKLSLEKTAEFDLFVETSKAEVEKGNSLKKWKIILKNAQSRWQELIKDVK